MAEESATPSPSDDAGLVSAVTEELDSIRQAAEQDAEYEQTLVDFITHQSAGMYLAGSNQSSPLRCLTPKAFQTYFDELYAQLGSPEWKDPLHRMLVEQLVVAHHVIGRLMMNTANCREIELLRTQCTLAVQLMSEFRRMTQAVNAYEPRKRASSISEISLAQEASEPAVVTRPQTRRRRGAA